jgi:GTPase
MSFVDESQLHVKAGNGGAGAVSTRREPFVPKGGPDGGNGGPGGDVYLVADYNIASLLGFRDHPFRRADDGTHGKGKEAHGRGGTDTIVPVPVGTVVKDQNGRVLADLAAQGHKWIAARGGRGGRGNASFLSNRRRAPDFAEQGEIGEEFWVNLELKLMADIALVGFPNAGKSTLISTVSAAKPKVADYPFTTLEPHLGVIRMERFGTAIDPRGDFEFVMADIPGLVEGAAEGKGLGHQFLRHIERARALLVLVDLSAGDDLSPSRQEEILLNELSAYRPELLSRPRLVVGTKLDAIGCVGESREDLLTLVPDAPELCISAIMGVGLRELLTKIVPLVAQARAEEPEAGTYVVHRPDEQGVRIERGDDAIWVVVGRSAERAVAVSDINNYQALAHVHLQLKALGVDRALVRAGAKPGDIVRVGDFEFEFD